MAAEGKEPTTIDFTTEEINEIKKMQIDYEKRQKEKRRNLATERRKAREFKTKVQNIEDFWNDPKRTKLE